MKQCSCAGQILPDHKPVSPHDVPEANAQLRDRATHSRASVELDRYAEIETAIAALSHDLRAPLRALDAYVQLLTAELPRETPESAWRYLERACRSIEVARGLVEQLLDYLRCGQGTVRCEELDLTAIARSIIDELDTINADRRVDVHIAGDLRAAGDPALVRRLLQNLLGNAWKFTRFSDDAQIRLYAERSPDGVRFCIEDNGCGFDMSMAEALFKPFQRLPTASHFDGYGLGLAIARRIVELHQGTIRAESRPSRGARFVFTLFDRS